MSTIRTSPLDEVVWQDIVDLAASGVAEDAMLEFKGLLPEKNGKEHPWYGGRDQITDFTRDELAAEVVALANAYGGRLIIGVAETQDRPRKAAGTALLPRCEKFAEQFEQALRSIVDPPIGGLQIRAITNPETDDTGAVVIAVPASDLAPHGIGRPPAAYVRRGTSCEPMTMRDLQSAFWEARTRRERIDQLREKARTEMRSLFDRILKLGIPQTRNAEAIPAGSPGMCVRMNAIPHQSLNLGPLNANSNWLLNLCPNEGEVCDVQHVELPKAGRHHGWTPRAHGVTAQHIGPWTWTLMEDGSLSALGYSSARENQYFPGWYVGSFAMFIATAERVRRRAGRPDVPVEVDFEFLHDGSARTHTGHGKHWPPPAQNIEIGPFLLEARDKLSELMKEIERVVWNGFSVPFVMPSGINFEGVFEPGGWSSDR